MLPKKTPYHHFSQNENKQSLSLIHKKTKSIYHVDASEINDAKYLQENMLNKLLRPPVKKESKGVLRKYDPQFPKPDVQKLIHENTLLKNQIGENNRIIMELRFKIKEQEKKIGKLELNHQEELQEIMQKKKKNPSVHIEILKKKIHELHTKFIAAQSQIKKLKKLPGASIYEENSIEKQHLLAETIRLKSILTSYQSHDHEGESDMGQKQKCLQQSAQNSINNAKFQQQFLRMLKQENQKLKATIRLLQNDKILMKARQTTQNKQSNDLKKELDHAKNRLILKEAQIQKLTHENQNLLFKKAAKFRLQKEEKENKLIQELTKSIQELKIEKKRLQGQKNELLIDNQELKKKEQQKNIQLIEKEKELQKAKFENADIKNQFEGRIKLLQTNKLYSKESGYGSKSSKGNRFNYNFNEGQDFGQQFQIARKNYDAMMEKNKEKPKFHWGKPVKFEDLDFCLLKIWSLKEEGIIQKYSDLLTDLSQLTSSERIKKKQTTITFEQLYCVLKSNPICLPSKQAIKLAKYIFADHYSLAQLPSLPLVPNSDKLEQPIIQVSLALTIIKASINQFTQCLSSVNVTNSWKIVLTKNKKLIRQLEQNTKDLISKEQLIEIVISNKNNTLLFEEINYMLLHGFYSKASTQQIMLKRKKVLQCMYGVMGDTKYLTALFLRSNFANFMPSEMSNQSSKQISIVKYCSKLNKENKQVRNNLAHDKNLQTNSAYSQQKVNKSKNFIKTHQPQNNNFSAKEDIAKELKMLGLKKVTTQSDEDKDKEVGAKNGTIEILQPRDEDGSKEKIQQQSSILDTSRLNQDSFCHEDEGNQDQGHQQDEQGELEQEGIEPGDQMEQDEQQPAEQSVSGFNIMD